MGIAGRDNTIGHYTPADLARAIRNTIMSSPQSIPGGLSLEDISVNNLSITGSLDYEFAVPGSVPTGVVMPFAGNTAPTDYLICDGTAISRTIYNDLFVLISTSYGAGDGSTTFNIPDIRGRVIPGYKSSDTAFDSLGETGGNKATTLVAANLPPHAHAGGSHSHSLSSHQHGYSHSYSSGSAQAYGSGTPYQVWSAVETTASTDYGDSGGSTGGPSAHNSGNGPGTSTGMNTQDPYIVLNYIIKT